MNVLSSMVVSLATEEISLEPITRSLTGVWMDVENMSGSTLEAMAEAVENSALMIVCFSKVGISLSR